MKKFKIIFILFFSIFCLCGTKVLAIKFPDSTTLQPIPDEGVPNISGNIDWPNTNQNPSPDTEGEINPDTDATIITIDDQNPSNSLPSSDPNSTNINSSTNISDPVVSNNTQNNGKSTPNSSSKNASNALGQIGQQNSDLSNTPTYNFDTISPQGDVQTQKMQAKDDNNANLDQNKTPSQKNTTGSTYVQILVWGSTILFAVAFVLWKLKKTPND
jgi:hypothetical protein